AGGTPLADVVVRPGVRHAGRTQASPPTTAGCEKLYKIACYQPAQIRWAYDLPPVYANGVTGQGTTIVIVDSFGSPTIRHDLAAFDSAFHLPAPPSFKVIQPAGRVPPYDPGNSDMVGWAGETTLDVQWAHAIAPDESTYYLFPVTSWPDSDPLVTGIGGTQLHFDAKGRPAAPTVWNDTFSQAANEFATGGPGPSPLAGGGGRSVLFGRPAYQDAVQ